SAPRKYFVVTMLAAFTDQKSGNSTPRCSKLTEPSRQLVMTTSRRSQVTSAYGWVPAVEKTRSTTSPSAEYRGPAAVGSSDDCAAELRASSVMDGPLGSTWTA